MNDRRSLIKNSLRSSDRLCLCLNDQTSSPALRTARVGQRLRPNPAANRPVGFELIPEIAQPFQPITSRWRRKRITKSFQIG